MSVRKHAVITRGMQFSAPGRDWEVGLGREDSPGAPGPQQDGTSEVREETTTLPSFCFRGEVCHVFSLLM